MTITITVARCLVFYRTVRYFVSVSGIKTIQIPEFRVYDYDTDNACGNGSTFRAIDTGEAMAVSGILGRARPTWQP